jgi:hypothetical protein
MKYVIPKKIYRHPALNNSLDCAVPEEPATRFSLKPLISVITLTSLLKPKFSSYNRIHFHHIFHSGHPTRGRIYSRFALSRSSKHHGQTPQPSSTKSHPGYIFPNNNRFHIRISE